MTAQDSGKDLLAKSGATGYVESKELGEDDLKAVTGGLSNLTGGGLSSSDTSVCVSSD